MSRSRYRTEHEVEAASRAKNVLYELDRIGAIVEPTDPLRRGIAVARDALMKALWLSPVEQIDHPKTLLEDALPQGPNALSIADGRSEELACSLEQLFERSLGLHEGPAVRRKMLVRLVVRDAHHLRAVLRGQTSTGILRAPSQRTVGNGPDGEAGHDALAAILACSNIATLLASPPPYLLSFGYAVSHQFLLLFGISPPAPLVCKAIVAFVQEAERPRGGRVPHSAIHHYEALAELLEAVDLYRDGAPCKTEKTPPWLEEDVREAKLNCQIGPGS